MTKHLSVKEKEEIISFYKSKPMTIEYLSTKFNLCSPTIIKILNQYRIKRYTKVQLYSPELEESFFEKIDSEYKAYFLGLIITDGCIYKKNSRQNLVSLTIKEEDKYILETFKKCIKSNKYITSDRRGCYSINILSNKMVKDLEKYGIGENKSLNTVFPRNIDKELYPHLIRGIIDGDGSISFYSRSGRKVHRKAVRLCQGNEQFLKDIVYFLYKNVGIIPVKTFKEKDNLWSIAYVTNDSNYKLINYLYKDSNIFLKRKKFLCDKILEEIKSYKQGNTEITS